MATKPVTRTDDRELPVREAAPVAPAIPLRHAIAVGLAVFISGAVLLGMEIAASRVVAPFFGNSLFVWGALIGVVLAGLSVGYWGGGVLADLVPAARVLLSVMALGPWLNSKGFPRGSYEVVCVVREPIDWLASWWRYRSREELADPSRGNHPNYAGHLSFEQFVRAYMDGEDQFAQVGRQAKFVRPRGGQAGVDRIFRYDRLNLLVAYLCEKVGGEVKIGTSNVSPKRSAYLSEECERELREFLAPEYRIYEGAIAG